MSYSVETVVLPMRGGRSYVEARRRLQELVDKGFRAKAVVPITGWFGRTTAVLWHMERAS